VLSITDRLEEFMRIEKVFGAAIALAFGLMSTASAEPIRIAMPSKSMTFLNFYLADRQIRFVQKRRA
jgi:hypothetical protein